LSIAIVLGTRPEIIKMSPIIRECERLGLDYFILHTGQHYSYNMDKVFFEQLELPEPYYNLGVGSGTHGEQTGMMLMGIEKVLMVESPGIVLVEGDTNTVVSGALAAQKLGIMVGHVEAGLRSYDRGMPEEINRIVADHVCDLLFTPTETSRRILLGEGIPDERIYCTGNTVVDAVYQNIEIAEEKANLDDFPYGPDEYCIATVHRQENVDNQARFKSVIKGLETLSKELELPIMYPVHPRAWKMMKQFNIKPSLELTEPFDYLTFLRLLNKSKLVLTDSGGVQEEACIMHVPCVTLRDNTERPETVEVGANIVAGVQSQDIVKYGKQMMNVSRDWLNPFGDGTAAQKIVKTLLSIINN
jgi:UDP-N-acetylglucosamine 2-epimerase (non-hydrolysing)